MSNGPLTVVEVSVEDIHALSIDLLEVLHEEQVEQGVAAFALVMTLGRVLSPTVLDGDKEIEFCQAMMEFAGMFFSEGEPN